MPTFKPTRFSYPLILFVLLFVAASALRAQLPYTQEAPAAAHLQEVNAEWTPDKLAKLTTQENISFASETERIQFHLNQVIYLIEHDETAMLSSVERAARMDQMNVLRDYAAVAEFPINTKHATRQPYFVDDFGTACAVGHLALTAGATDLVAQIKTEKNYAYINELDYPALNAWAATNGLSMGDLALIQPGYPPTPTEWKTMGDGSGVAGKINDMEVFGNELIIVGAFSSIHGHAANNIVRWDGEQFSDFDIDIEGEIYDAITFANGAWNLAIAGDFSLNGFPANIAVYTDGVWKLLQNGEMEGAIHALHHSSSMGLIAGGDFKKINGHDMPYLAVYDNDNWSQTTEVFGNESENGAFSVSGPVYDLDYYGSWDGTNVLVSGDFLEVQNNAVSSQPMSTRNMAYWNVYENKWQATFDGDYGVVKTAGISDGRLYFGGDVSIEGQIYIMEAGLISSMSMFAGYGGDGQFHDLYSAQGNTFILGGFTTGEITMLHQFGMLPMGGPANSAVFNNSVYCMTFYKGNYYTAGEYTAINNKPFNQLAFSTLQQSVGVNEQLSEDQLKIYAANGQVYYQTDQLINELDLHIYDASGRLVDNNKYDHVYGNNSLELNQSLNGVYFYEAKTEEGYQTGKLTMVER